MSSRMKRRLPGPVGSYEVWWVIGFCLLAALVPFFKNVDERRQSRTVVILGAVEAIDIFVSVSDLLANRIAFTSAYNWFHM